jgi:precorrin-2/cobalt-factor-2 C20-methyltransferase
MSGMQGTLYVVGIGPGDPELLTMKAFRVLKEVPCLFFPKGREEGSSLARTIVEAVLDLGQKEVQELHFPMSKKGEGDEFLPEKWQEAALRVLERLREGKDVAFLTLGDPGFYSTYFYLDPIIRKALPDVR